MMRSTLSLTLFFSLGFFLAFGQDSPHEKALLLLSDHLTSQQEVLGISEECLQNAEVSDIYTTDHNLTTHIYFQQTFHSIPVSGVQLSAHIQGNEVFGLHHNFLSGISEAALSVAPTLSASDAITQAADYLGLDGTGEVLILERPLGMDQEGKYQAMGLSHEPVSVRLRWVLSSSQLLRLAWEVRIYSTDYQHWWGIWIDAEDASVLMEDDWVISCLWHPAGSEELSDHSGHTTTWDAPLDLFAPFQIMATPEYRVFPMPVESPNHGGRVLISDPSDSLASPFGWHDTDGMMGEEYTITRGNNVLAQDDQNGDNGSGFSPDGGAALSFDFPLPTGVSPFNYLEASATNLFYWNNLMHDVWYHYGFDEEAGNFQENNYGRGGEEGDWVYADAQDGGFFNNANFATPPDGNPGRMQMYLWRTGGTSSNDFLTIHSPTAIAGPYTSAEATFGPGVTNTPVTADLVLVVDSAGTSEACSSITNVSELNGKIAVLFRGTCDFVEKVQRCQDAGAIGVVIVNHQPTNIFAPSGNSQTIVIPSLMISQADGAAIITTMAGNTVNGSIVDPGNPSDRDGSFDSGVISHEYAHGISNRLTGGPSINCLNNQEQPGEGWSDFFALVMTTDASHQATDARGVGTFVFGQPTTGVGIRDYPYSTDMNISPYVYDDIKTLSIPHGVGSVMCAMLWDLYWAMVDQYGFDSDIYHGTGGNNMAMQLVIDGMKLQPCSPGFADVRDAILLADQLTYGGANQCLIWEVFARRGLGYSASQGQSASRSDGVSAFDLPPSCLAILYLEKETEALSVGLGETVRYRFVIRNQKDSTVSQVILTDTLPDPLIFVQGSSTHPASVDGNVVSIILDSIPAGQDRIIEFDALVPATATASSFVYEENFDSSPSSYLPSAQVGSDGWVLDTANPRSGQYAWFVPNVGATNDQRLTFPVQPLSAPAVLTFWHEFRTEAGYDGGVIEILPTQSGGAWIDLGPFILENGYSVALATNNPLGDVPAFSGSSRGYIKTSVDLSAFLNQQLFIRFRFVSDDNTNVEGWWIDDIRIGQEVEFVNAACIESDQGDVYCSQQASPTLILNSLSSSASETFDQWSLDLIPNPAQDQVSILWENNYGTPGRISVRNMVGQLLWEEPLNARAGRSVLDLASWPTGVYLVRIDHESGSITKKLLVE